MTVGSDASAPVAVHLPGLMLVEHELSVPLDHADPGGEQIPLFAREVAEPDGRDKPFLVYLQGGPGQEAPRPVPATGTPGWLGRALEDYRVVLLDQRGTGLSGPVGDLGGGSPQEHADRLSHFRADAIVADCELLRDHLGVDRWSVLGQSFGGFCALRYLSVAPHALREALFTGGLPPVGRVVDEIYAATWTEMLARNRHFYDRYPGDRSRMLDLLERAEGAEIVAPNGRAVGVRQLRGIGNNLGMSDGADLLHYLLERDHTSPGFRHDLAATMPFDARSPLYALLNEPGYVDGGTSDWAALRTMPDELREDPTLFFGEHVFPWTFEDDPGLAPYAEVAELLATRAWPALYDADVLSGLDVPCASAVYADDPYVTRALSEETAAMIPTMRTWVTDELLHNGLRVDGARVLDRLLTMVREPA